MGLASGQAHVIGRHQKFFAKAETTAGTFIKPTAADAVKTQQSMMKHEVADEPIDDNSSYRYDTETIQDKAKNTWSWDGYLIPSGTAATEPDAGPMIKAALGADNSGAASKWIYTVASVQAWPTLSLCRHFNAIFQETMWGAFVDKISFKLAGGAQPLMHLEGRAMGYVYTGATTLNGAMSSATMVVATADKYKCGINSVVQIDANNNTGAGWKVTVESARPSFTIEGSVTEASGDPVVPYVPTPTYTGSPISGNLGAITLDTGSILPITSVEITLENDHEAFEDEVMSQNITDLCPGKVKVSCAIGLRLRQDQLVHLVNPQEFATRDLYFCVGDTAGSRFKFDIDYGQAKMPDISIPKDHKAGAATMNFVGLGSGANGPLIITHD